VSVVQRGERRKEATRTHSILYAAKTVKHLYCNPVKYLDTTASLKLTFSLEDTPRMWSYYRVVQCTYYIDEQDISAQGRSRVQT
jgi:hypothetical protein